MIRAFAICVVLAAPASALAQKVGDKVAFVRDSPVMSEGKGVGTAYKGVIETVREVNGDRLAIVYSRSPQGTIRRTVPRQDVIPIADALDYFTDELKKNPTSEMYKIRGDVHHSVSPLEMAIKDYDEAIRLDPKNFAAWIARGSAWGNSGNADKQIENQSEAIRLNPKYALSYVARGMAYRRKREFQKAMNDLNTAAAIDPQYGLIFLQRGEVLAELKQFKNAILDFERAIELDPRLWDAQMRRAWMLAACPDARLRDGKLAIELATKLCEQWEWKEASTLMTLAAACAQEGRFEEAVKWQTRAQSAILDAEEAARSAPVIDLYKAHKAWPQDEPLSESKPAP